jgi:putative glutamine amidotransferase
LSASDRPVVVGLTTYVERAQQGVWDVPAAYLQYQYVESVTRVGAVATLLPPQPVSAAAVHAVLDRIDALVLTGGKDVDARLYGEVPHAEADEPRTERDAWELGLLRGALDRGMPVLGICRGAQVLNVALGGTLEQHLPDAMGGADDHRAGLGRFAGRTVRTVPGSRLASILGEGAGASCYHHQAIAKLAPDLVASGHAEDGIVEAVELPGERFVLAVQWHPEETLDDVRLFHALVEAAAPGGRAPRHAQEPPDRDHENEEQEAS